LRELGVFVAAYCSDDVARWLAATKERHPYLLLTLKLAHLATRGSKISIFTRFPIKPILS
jgi:hypothetical protein